jgi:threonine synthase
MPRRVNFGLDMRFIDEKNELFGLFEATASGYPSVGAAFSPAGDADLRPAVYAPEASYVETASSAIASLFPEEVDPLMAERLAARAFPLVPASRSFGKDILVADYTAGPSASAADSEASLLAGILVGVARHSGPRILLAEGSGYEGAALSEALAGLRDLRLALLYPAGQAARGIKGQRLSREGGHVKLISVRGDRAAVGRLIREAAGKSLAGMGATAAGPANPARFAARIVTLASTFALLRKGIAADLYIGIRAGDGRGLAACLWAWRLGLPIGGIVLAVGEKGVLGSESSGRFLVERFDKERPGVIRSLALLQRVERDEALGARDRLIAEGGPGVDLATAMTMAAAERALEAGLGGQARIIVPYSVGYLWEEGGGTGGPEGALHDARVDAEIEPSVIELERALTV